ncbi:MAG TPA: sulfite exporter TauE/SafE family protein [Thermoanaerobaculia bacterium]|nr:sulfite exporter TauE/SafE family protein [Thermoanaerobaculia bacterium]
MLTPSELGLAALILIAAVLYSSVGHAGASGYLAVMALWGIAPETMKPTALTLNILVATIGTVKFYRAGHFSWRLFWPFALASVPCAFLGGGLSLPGHIYKPVVGAVLLFSALRMLKTTARAEDEGERAFPPIWVGLVWGALIGLLSGLTGVGGGIFLSPLLLVMGWAGIRATAGVSALFILVNSVAGLAGHLSSVAHLPANLPLLLAAAGIGGWIGAHYGSRRIPTRKLRWLLAVVLVIAGFKLIFA